MTLFLNGIFNNVDPWNLAPIYLWGLILWWVVLLPVAWWLLKALKWAPFHKFHGLHYAKKNDSAACLITDDTGDTEMVAEHIAKCIFSYGEDDYEIEMPAIPLRFVKIIGIILAIIGFVLIFTGNLSGLVLIVSGVVAFNAGRIIPWFYGKLFWYPTKYLKDIPWNKAILYKIGHVNYDCKIARQEQHGEWDQYPVVNCGGIGVEWIFDSDHWCERKTRQHKEIVKSARAWNKEHPDDQIHTYTKYQRYLTAGLIETPQEIKKDYLVPWVRIDLGFPFNLKNVEWAGKQRQMAKIKELKKGGEGTKYFWPIIFLGVGMFFAILIIRILMIAWHIK